MLLHYLHKFALLSQLVVVYSKLKYLDQHDIKGIHDLKKLPNDATITIEKEDGYRYLQNVSALTRLCSSTTKTLVEGTSVATKTSGLEYKICHDSAGREIKLIPSYIQSDLDSPVTYMFKESVKQSKPYAPHYIILEDVALYGHGDIMGLDGTSHYLGVCRQYGPPGYDSISVKRGDVAQFFDEPVFNLVTLWTENYFNALLAYLPRYLTLIQILKTNPNIMIAKNLFVTHADYYIEPILEYYGLSNGTSRALNFVNIEYGRVYFAKYLISPLSNCRFISRHSIMMIRKAVAEIFKINIINLPSSTSPSQSSSSSQSPPQIDQHTIVISDRREFDDLYSKFYSLYGKDYKIVKYNPTLGAEAASVRKFLEFTVKMFSSCKIFITAFHSEESANIIFMNPGAVVIEVRPIGSSGWHPAYFASSVGIQYYPSWSVTASNQQQHNASQKQRSKSLVVDVQNVLSSVASFLNTPSSILNIDNDVVDNHVHSTLHNNKGRNSKHGNKKAKAFSTTQNNNYGDAVNDGAVSVVDVNKAVVGAVGAIFGGKGAARSSGSIDAEQGTTTAVADEITALQKENNKLKEQIMSLLQQK